MAVNPNYKGIELPTQSWPLLDTFESPKSTAPTRTTASDNPVPFLPLVAAPVARLRTISQALQFALANSQTTCQLLSRQEGRPGKLVAQGRQTAGHRFMIGVTSLGGAERYGSTPRRCRATSTAARATKFTSSAGRTFVGPSDASLKAAVKVLVRTRRPAPGRSRRSTLRKSRADGYPGTMIVYTSRRPRAWTRRLPRTIAAFIRYVGRRRAEGRASTSATSPPGYLPITKANGLAAFAAAANASADAIAAQKGATGAQTPTTPTDSATPDERAARRFGAERRAEHRAGADRRPSPRRPAETTNPASALAALGATLGLGSGVAALVLPLVLLLAILAGLIAGGVYVVGRTRAHLAWKHV